MKRGESVEEGVREGSVKPIDNSDVAWKEATTMMKD